MAKISTNAEINSIRLKEQASAPATPASGYGQIYIKADGLYFKGDDGTEIGPIGGSSAAAIYPQQAKVVGPEFKVVAGGGSLNIAVNTAQILNVLVNTSTNTDGDAIEASVLLKAGTYDVKVFGTTANNKPILDWSLDGTNFITGQDWYSASVTYNVVKTGTVTISNSGRHLVRATVNGKNASSSGYVFTITAILFIAQTLSSET